MVVEIPERSRVAAIPAPIWPAPSTPARKAIGFTSVPLQGGRADPGRRPDRSGLGCEEDDLDPARGKLCQGRILEPRDLGAEADRGDLARSEPAGRVDSVLLDQIPAHGVGLLLGQDLGKFDVVVIVGEGGDDDLRLRLAGLLAPAPHLVEAGAADWCQDGAPRLEKLLIPEQSAVAPRARLEQDLLTLEEGARVKIAGQRPGSLERGEVVFHGRESSLAPAGQGHQVLISGLITDQFAERTLALPDRAGNDVDLFEPGLGGPGQVI